MAICCYCLTAEQGGQQQLLIAPKIASGAGTWTLTQSVADRKTYGNNLNCVAAVCTLTVPSTGTGHGALLSEMDTDGLTISSVTGGCTWTVQSTAVTGSGPVGNINAATCLSTSSGTTAIVITMSGSPSDITVFYREVSWSGSSISFDVCGAASRATATTAAGPTLTLSGSSDAIIQMASEATSLPSSVTSPYNTNFLNTATTGGGGLGFSAGSVAINQSAGTAPIWTLGANTSSLVNACALKGN